MVSQTAAQSSAVGSPRVPGPKSTASSPAATGASPQSTTTWSMQTRPAIGRTRPATRTGPALLAARGTPSPYPRGTTASVVSRALRGRFDERRPGGGGRAAPAQPGVHLEVDAGRTPGGAGRRDQLGDAGRGGRGQVDVGGDALVQRQPGDEQPGEDRRRDAG